jgi:hypothetical protein
MIGCRVSSRGMVVGIDRLWLASAECLSRSEMELKFNWKFCNQPRNLSLVHTYIHRPAGTVSVYPLDDLPAAVIQLHIQTLDHLLCAAMDHDHDLSRS